MVSSDPLVGQQALHPDRLVVIVGPTGAGKTELSLALAKRIGAHVVSADSQQVYRGMDIGTGKVCRAARAIIPHHGIDIVEPAEQMTAARFVSEADAAIRGARELGRPVVVVGGTGLYVRALLHGLFDGPPANKPIRARIAAQAATVGTNAVWDQLRKVDPITARHVLPTDLIRMTRALEVYELTGVPLSVHHDNHRRLPPRYTAMLVGVAPGREALYRTIDARVEDMLATGLVGEVEGLRARGVTASMRSQAAIGYAELHQYLDGTISLLEATRLIQRNSRRYARRQLSWYRPNEAVTWHATLEKVDLGALERYLTAHPLGQDRGDATHRTRNPRV